MTVLVTRTPPPTPIALVGPTASGKSAVSMHLARHWPLEIISVDSALVYRGMDIGTAKPTAAERATVPHHLIDIRNPDQPYSAAEFAADAQALITDIQARGKHVLLVGGTLLYLKALMQPMDDMPPAQPALRAQLEAEAHAQGWPALHAQLARVDPTTAARLSPNDSQRVGRALEVYRATGQPLSAFHTRATASPHGHTGTPAHTPAQTPPRANKPFAGMPVISLEPTDRAWLHHRIGQRFDAMLQQGLVDEVRRLMALPTFHPDLPSMRCVGYRQVWDVLQWRANHAVNATVPAVPAVSAVSAVSADAVDQARPAMQVDAVHMASTGCLNAEQTVQSNQASSAKMIQHMRETGMAATRQLAKRQLTWLRGMPERHTEACDAPLLAERVQARVQQIWG